MRTDPDLVRHTLDMLEGRRSVDPALRAEFERAVVSQRPKIYGFCLRLLGNPQQAEDLTQETLLTACLKLPQFEARARLSTWMCGIARFLAFNEIRRHGELLTEDGVLEAGDDCVSVLRDLTRHERERLLQEAAVACLDETEQEVVHLRYVENLPRQQIAELLGVDTRVVLQRCTRKLRREVVRRLEELGHGLSFVRTTAP